MKNIPESYVVCIMRIHLSVIIIYIYSVIMTTMSLFCHNISIMYAYLCRWCLLMQYYFVVSADKNLKNRE